MPPLVVGRGRGLLLMREVIHLSVSMLRRKLKEKGFEVDGSKEMLISRLEKGDESNDTVNGEEH